jgi:protoporphyrinogen IX oxidase
MSPELVPWFLAVHVVGFVFWVGGMTSALQLTAAHASAESGCQKAFVPVEKRLALLMDIGATLAIVAGLALLFGITPSPLTAGGWMHIKLTAAVALIGLHGYTRVRIKKLGRGEVSPLPGWVLPTQALLVVAIVIMVMVRPFSG